MKHAFHCPAHNDKNPSLRIWLDNNRLTFFCFAGCSQEKILLAIDELGLFDDNIGQKWSSCGGKGNESKP